MKNLKKQNTALFYELISPGLGYIYLNNLTEKNLFGLSLGIVVSISSCYCLELLNLIDPLHRSGHTEEILLIAGLYLIFPLLIRVTSWLLIIKQIDKYNKNDLKVSKKINSAIFPVGILGITLILIIMVTPVKWYPEKGGYYVQYEDNIYLDNHFKELKLPRFTLFLDESYKQVFLGREHVSIYLQKEIRIDAYCMQIIYVFSVCVCVALIKRTSNPAQDG